MTLHWWMHWFWITYQFTCCIILTHSMPLSPTTTMSSDLEMQQNRPLQRSVKSIDQITIPKSKVSITLPFPDTSDTSDYSIGINENLSQFFKSKTTIAPVPERDKIICLNITSIKNSTTELKNETLPLCSKQSEHVNASKRNESNTTIPSEDVTGSSEIISENSTSDNNSYTNVINSTLTSVIVTKELVSSKISNADNISSSSNLTAVSITGISFGVLIFAAFVGVTTFVLYRRRYLNKPQTLNDKCSNPDSSGYIDDNTIRENSEEMYSLDNDSFLNSLEAMTIQNYWTDSVKHTKL